MLEEKNKKVSIMRNGESRRILIIKRGEDRFDILLEILLERGRIDKKDVEKVQAIEMFTVIK